MSSVNRRNAVLLYNTQDQPRELIQKNFVIRRKLLRSVWQDILKSDMKNPEQHYIIQGVRGSGKTTFLLKLAYDIEDEPSLQNWLIPIVFKEEEYSLNTFGKFWELVAEILENQKPFASLFTGLSDKLDQLYDTDSQVSPLDLFTLISQELRRQDKKIILFIDNIENIFGILSDHDEKVFREILLENNQIRFVGASSKSLEATYDYGKPFFQFFKFKTLKPIKQKETTDLLLKIAEFTGEKERMQEIIKKDGNKIEALRRLTDGVPRSIVLLFDILLDGGSESSFSYLNKMLDGVTPLYKHRVDDLPKEQRPIFDAIAQQWDGILVKEIAQKTRGVSKKISAQLNKMEKNWIIEKRRQTNSKNHIYLLSERFFNIWYLMRYGRKRDEKRVAWLTNFLEIWCSKDEIQSRTKTLIRSMKQGEFYPEGAAFYTTALLHTKHLSMAAKQELHDAAKSALTKNGLKSLADQLPDIKKVVAGVINEGTQLMIKAIPLMEKGEFKAAEKQILKIKNKNKELNFLLGVIYHQHLKQFDQAEKYYLRAIEQGDIKASYNLALLYQEKLENYPAAEKCYLKAVEQEDVNALFNLAVLYQTKIENYPAAEKYYLKAIELGHSMASNNLATLYISKLENYTKAEEYFLKAIELGLTGVVYNLALLYADKLENYSAAEKYYLKAIEQGDVDAFYNLAILYAEKLENYTEAEKYYLKAIEQGNVDAFYNLANLYKDKLENYSAAEKNYLKAIEQEQVGASNNLAILYTENLENYSAAEKYYLQAIEQGVFEASNNLGLLYEEKLENYSAAEKYYLQAIDKGLIESAFNLALLYEEKLENYSAAEKYYLKAIEENMPLASPRLVFSDFQKNRKNKRKRALKLAEQYAKKAKGFRSICLMAIVNLWNDHLEEAIQLGSQLLEYWEKQEGNDEDLITFLELLIAKGQTQAALNLFQKFQLKDRFKPLYYALMHFMKDEYPNELLRMGDELSITVDEIVDSIHALSKKYNS